MGFLPTTIHKGHFTDPGYDIEVEDNIGSGMAFSAGFLHFYLNGKSIQQATQFWECIRCTEYYKAWGNFLFQ